MIELKFIEKEAYLFVKKIQAISCARLKETFKPAMNFGGGIKNAYTEKELIYENVILSHNIMYAYNLHQLAYTDVRYDGDPIILTPKIIDYFNKLKISKSSNSNVIIYFDSLYITVKFSNNKSEETIQDNVNIGELINWHNWLAPDRKIFSSEPLYFSAETFKIISEISKKMGKFCDVKIEHLAPGQTCEFKIIYDADLKISLLARPLKLYDYQLAVIKEV
jgi:hypothetical protein